MSNLVATLSITNWPSLLSAFDIKAWFEVKKILYTFPYYKKSVIRLSFY
ncbi:hypothetical protein [Cytobacillus sp. IB215665]|nr:hypothetical protein [Cytobacillus sp. IB215665]MDX8365286.1 hypothetical protein [Cytobacillus sp. IB215665]